MKWLAPYAVTLSLSVGILIAGWLSPTLLARAASRPDDVASNGPASQLNGHVPRRVRDGRAVRIGPADPSEIVTVALVMPLRDEATLTALIDDISNPASSRYGQYLTPTVFSSRYGATDSQRQSVESFLSQRGLRETQVFNNGNLIVATATIGILSSAFGIDVAIFRDSDGTLFRAPTNEPNVPAALAGTVTHVAGLDSLPAVRSPRLTFTSAGSYSPAQVATAYDAAALLGSGTNGKGENLAVIEFATYDRSDLAAFNRAYANSTSALDNMPVCGGATSDPNGDAETTLDLEMQMATAPGVTSIIDYNAPNSIPCADAMYQQVATDNRATVVSNSWGICELDSSSASMADPALHNAFLQMASQGQSLFASAGDSGAKDCYTIPGPSQNESAVDYPASDNHVTGVGGTTLMTASNGSYLAETTWNQGFCDQSGCGSGGGGLSQVFPRPTWQIGPGTTNQFSNGMREVPDVSLDADPNTGYVFVYQGIAQVVGGTSAAAPIWSGYAAIYNQYAAQRGKPRLGFANPALYGVGNSGSRLAAFHDVTRGNNITYPATDGFDLATGWGSPDLGNLVVALARGSPFPTPTPTCTPTSLAPPAAPTRVAGGSVVFLPAVPNGRIGC